ncbi:MAG: DmsE family decaheme c-type cytochrome [Betaproteobacteria bacterium]|nr:DmsE family decaheme c-type cytochrome [Betaproteobacteria bacterium]
MGTSHARALSRIPLLILVVAAIALPGTLAQASAATGGPSKGIVLNDDARCTKCHDEGDSPKVLSIGQTRHGVTRDGRTPTCTSCHGASDKHVNKPDGAAARPAPDIAFKGAQRSPAADQNGACLACHQNESRRSHWAGSTHESRDVSCTDCHQMHTAHDKVRDRKAQPEVCFACHKTQRAEVARTFRHPILEGKVACSDCHNSHGSVGPKLMKRDSVVETCYQCHAEKRGPFVHNHEPVNEDCSNCHNPHGTVADSMLKVRPPFLCHQCHTPHGGQIAQLGGQNQTNPAYGSSPTSPLLGPLTGGKSGINYTQGRGCLNCHTQVHGTNNPSATNPTPKFNLR